VSALVERVHFVLSERAWVEKLQALPTEELHSKSISSLVGLGKLRLGPNLWIAQSFLQLAKRGCNVAISSDYVEGQINVMHFDDVQLARRPKRAFLVVARADRPVPVPADLVIVQNLACIENPKRDHFLPHWPHPGLRARDPARGDAFENLVYLGNASYCGPDFYGEDMKKALSDAGIKLEIREDPKQWADYSDMDAILAVRQATEYDKNIKPPLKLFNAWRAGSLPFMGVESSYRQVGVHGQDYIELAQPSDLVTWCQKLKEEPERAREIRAAGAAAAERFSDDAIAEQWIQLLDGPVARAYRKWRARPASLRRLWSVASLPLSYLERRRERQRFEAGIGLEKS